MTEETMSALEALAPRLSAALPRVALGEWPSPLEMLDGGGDFFVKREDLSAGAYGGNKIRPLEVMFGQARRAGAGRIWSTGAMGSNHALASAIHAERVGLASGALLFPQPSTETARKNLRALASVEGALRLLNFIGWFPLAVAKLALEARRTGDFVMAPGAATPLGALGHLSAGLEVAMQVEEGEAPSFRQVVLPVGSTCTAAGLLVSLALAASLGVGWREAPHVHGIRVTPWPVTDVWRVAMLAAKTSALMARLGGPELDLGVSDFRRRLTIHGGHIGRGYGHPTRDGAAAIRQFESWGGPALDTTYSAKAAAFLFSPDSRLAGPTLFWATKSAATLPEATPAQLSALPSHARRWLKSRR